MNRRDRHPARVANQFSGYRPDGRDGPDADGWWATSELPHSATGKVRKAALGASQPGTEPTAAGGTRSADHHA